MTGHVERPLQSLQDRTENLRAAAVTPGSAETAAQDAHTELVSAVLGALKQALDDPGHVKDAELAGHRLMFAARSFARAADALPDEDLPAAWRVEVGETSGAGNGSRFVDCAGHAPIRTVLDGLDERAREASATGQQGQAFARGLWTATQLVRKALEAEVGETSGAGNGSRFAGDAAQTVSRAREALEVLRRDAQRLQTSAAPATANGVLHAVRHLEKVLGGSSPETSEAGTASRFLESAGGR